jgi:hypothetical protein
VVFPLPGMTPVLDSGTVARLVWFMWRGLRMLSLRMSS